MLMLHPHCDYHPTETALPSRAVTLFRSAIRKIGIARFACCFRAGQFVEEEVRPDL
jgi:hypothetical protein